jgi:hypothetical protein
MTNAIDLILEQNETKPKLLGEIENFVMHFMINFLPAILCSITQDPKKSFNLMFK